MQVNSQVQLGVIGCGVNGQTHIEHTTAVPTARVVAVADLREAVAREAAQRFGAPDVYANADA